MYLESEQPYRNPLHFCGMFVLLLVTSCFSVGFQALPILCFIQNVTLCWMLRAGRRTFWMSAIDVLLIYIALAIGVTIGFLGIFNDPNWTASNAGGAFGYAFSSALVYIPMEILEIGMHWAARNGHTGRFPFLKALMFPLSWTAVQTVLYYVSPVGSWGHQAYTFYNFSSLYQIVSIGGIASVTFVVALTASMVQLFLSGTLQTTSENVQLDNHSSTEKYRSLCQPNIFLEHPSSGTVGAVFCIFLVLLYGDVKHLNPSNTFFQNSVDFRTLPTVQASCLLGSNGSPSSVIARTLEIAQSGSKLILWSEESASVYNNGDLAYLQQGIINITSEYQILVGIGYENFLPNGDIHNQLMVAENGQILFDYQKSHPVPGVEKGVVAGPETIYTAESPRFGKIGAAICFDFDFPQFINKAGQHGVDFMLQASWTWGPIRELHSLMASTRAMENGFTLFRCSSNGVSGAYTPFQRTVAMYEGLKSGGFTMDIPIHPRTITPYAAMGEWFGWLCFCLAGILGIWLVVKRIRS